MTNSFPFPIYYMPCPVPFLYSKSPLNLSFNHHNPILLFQQQCPNVRTNNNNGVVLISDKVEIFISGVDV